MRQLLSDLVRIPSVTDDIPRVNEAVEYVRSYLEAHGVPCVLEDLRGRHILYASTQPGKVQDYLLNAHLDVVPAPAEMFEPRIDADNIMHARGCHDCKNNVVVIMRTLCDLLGKASVGAIFSTDEEKGGETTKAMVERGYGARRLVLVLDGPSHGLAIAQKGTVSYRLHAHGVGGHSSAPWLFVNAIDKLIDAYAKLKAAWPKPADVPEHWYDTFAATIIHAGTVENRIPDEATLTVNIRYVEPDGAAYYERFLHEVTGLEVERVRDALSVPVVCDENNPEVVAFRTAMQRQWPDRDIFTCRMQGATDARFFVALGVPIAITGAGGDDAHADSEHFPLVDLDEFTAMLEAFLAARRPETSDQ